jgi:hypothetical protein
MTINQRLPKYEMGGVESVLLRVLLQDFNAKAYSFAAEGCATFVQM